MYKTLLFQKIFNEAIAAAEPANLKILELGSGQSKYVMPILKQYPEVSYLGVEPSASDASKAQSALKDFERAQVNNGLAYNLGLRDEYDVCVSLSVLEHVKRLDDFIKSSVEAVKPGGLIVHMYDLGHTLYPASAKERLQINLSKLVPFLIPEHKFIAYISRKMLCDRLEQLGAEVIKVTYHQMPSHKRFMNSFKPSNDEETEQLARIFEWEFEVSGNLEKIAEPERELLFPSVCIWARKKRQK